MALLALEHVAKRHRQGSPAEDLRDVCLELHERELIALWGPRVSGRSTLLRIAAGIEAPDSGVVRFRGRQLAAGGGATARGIAYCPPPSHRAEPHGVMQALSSTQAALGVRPAEARAR
ncbi:MAG: ATP-binding cassette domain-containing protein, partial [Solirubrobacterales bacterium]|nr:ATP-binding cassette domain-containing protein [Solirubrobacterales bacterium]